MGIWANEEEMVFIEEDSSQTPYQTLFLNTPGASQMPENNTPMTPNTQGVLQGVNPKNGQQRSRFKSSATSKAMKQKDPKDLPVPVKTWAQTAALKITKDIMQEKDNSKYVELLVAKKQH